MKSSFYSTIGIYILIFVSGCEGPKKKPLIYWNVGSATNDDYVHSDLFNKTSDFEVETISIPWTEYDKKTLTAILSGNPPDIMSQFAPLKTWASRRSLIALNDFIDEDNYDTTQFFGFLWDEMKWNNKIYGIPINTTSYAFFYNKDIFNDANINYLPESWDDVIKIANRINKFDKDGKLVRAGFLPNYGNFMTSNVIGWQLGEKYIINGKHISLNTPLVKESFVWVRDFIHEIGLNNVLHLTGSFGFADQHGFISGKVGMMILDSAFPKLIEKYNPALRYRVIPIPSYKGSKSVSSGGVWWAGIPRGAKNPKNSWEFIKFLASAENQLDYLLNTDESLFSANKLAAIDSINYKFPYYNIFMDQLKVSRSPSIVPLAHDIFWREYKLAEDRIIMSDQNIDEILETAQNNVQTSLDKSLKYYEYISTRLNE